MSSFLPEFVWRYTSRGHVPLSQHDSTSRHDELDATFGGPDDDDPGALENGPSPPASSPPSYPATPADKTVDDPLSRHTTALPSSDPSHAEHDPSQTAAASSSSTPPSATRPHISGRYDFDSDPFSRPPARPRGRSVSSRTSMANRSAYNFNTSSSSTTPPGVTLDDDDNVNQPLHASSSSPSQSQSWLSRFNPFHFTRKYTPLRGSDGRMVVGSGVGNDGVFANLNAKPEHPRRPGPNGEMEYVGGDDEDDGGRKEVPPSYDDAAADSAPPYWETTVIAPSSLGPDDVLVDGLPVGNLFGFAWNLLVSMSFQFVGFLLTYVLHTSHAAKNGSRAGLGITLIQYGIYLQARPEQLNDGSRYEDGEEYSDPNAASNSMSNATILASDDQDDTGNGFDSDGREHGAVGTWLSYVLMAIGWMLIVGSVVNYWRAVRWARAVRDQPTGTV